ncbi:MAG: hypothetical protein J5555_04585 [Firmicutes bacterium]|nr:hypothetical protein [Lachnospiraceae bacterium]MBO4880938.1 hypothetical protein [Bacillota bacterium]
METKKSEKFYLGTFGAVLPFLAFVACIIYLCIQHKAGSATCGAAAFVGYIVAFFTMKDKARFKELTLKGFGSNMLAAMLIAFLLAGVIAKMMALSGLTNSLVWVAMRLGLNARFFPLLIFITAAIISSATGTSAGTMSTVSPVLLPMAIAMGCHPALSVGSVIAGSMFGDNLAPVSDTTIASAVSQETSVTNVVRTRFKYCIIAGLISAVLYIYFGMTTTQAVDASAIAMDANPAALSLLVVPILVVILMLRQKGLVFSMTLGIVVGLALCLVFGLIPASEILTGSGVIAGGFSGMMGIFPFFYFIYSMIEFMHEGGVIEAFQAKVEAFATTPTKADISAGLLATLGSVMISSPTVTIITFGPIVRNILKKFNIDRTRGANIMDGIACAFGGILPYAATFLVGVTQAELTGVIDATKYTSFSYIPYVFHCWALLAVFWISIFTGWGRKIEDPAHAAEGYDVVDTL